MKRLRNLALTTGLVVAVLLGALGAAAKDTLPELRRNLLNAHGAPQLEKALFELTEKIGVEGFYADHGAFADWLAGLPDGKPEHPLVRQRIGWALVRAKRGAEAVPHLEAALKGDPSAGLTRAYLGEALRQSKKYMPAAEMLASAVRCGEDGDFVPESLVSTLVLMQQSAISGHADDLPGYVLAAEAYLRVKADPRIHQMVADMLLTDFQTYEKPERDRGQSWARSAAHHVLKALALSPGKLANGAQMAYDAAQALEVLTRKTNGSTLRFDLLCQAYKLGIDPADGTHARPQVLTLLAEAAAAEGRFELAYRIAQERLGISNSPRARRLLMQLPPDLGLEEGD